MTISELYSLFLKHSTVTIDSRNCPPDSLFFALKGETFDGNAFAEQALKSGCAYAIVDDPAMVTDKRMLLCDNVLNTLQQLARIHRQSLKIPVIGITGTNGKTTTKELTATVLSQKYKTLYTRGNLNNHIGVPLTLLQLTGEHEIAVIEMGANHPCEIGELAAIACPDYGLITNVGYAHLEGFGSLEGVIKTKGELYDYLRGINGTVFIHRDNEYLTGIAGALNQIMYGAMDLSEKVCSGKNEVPFIGGKITGLHPFLSFSWQRCPDEVFTVQTKLVGGYNLWNALAAIAIGVHFNVPHEKINEAIANYEPTNNRSQLKKTAHNELIIDAYNANPSSMHAALENFSALTTSQKTVHFENSPKSQKPLPKAVILGDMLELGEKSTELHASIIKQIEAYHFDNVLLCGENFSKTGQQYTCFPTVEKLTEYLKTNPLQGYHILIKGSHSIHLEKTIELL